MRGKFITFEGIDGSGKSTQVEILAGELRSGGIDVLTTREPGGTPLGQRLREAFLETEETVAPLAELLLFAADRAQHVEHLIRPALASGRTVISDRYADATRAYQGAGRGFDRELTERLITLATGGLEPDLTVFFDLSVEAALARMRGRENVNEQPNRMDLEAAAFYEKVRAEYLAIAAREPERFKVIDADASIAEVAARVRAAVSDALPKISGS